MDFKISSYRELLIQHFLLGLWTKPGNWTASSTTSMDSEAKTQSTVQPFGWRINHTTYNDVVFPWLWSYINHKNPIWIWSFWKVFFLSIGATLSHLNMCLSVNFFQICVFLLWNEMFSFDKSEALAEAKILLQTGSCKANRSQWIPGIRWCWHLVKLLFWIEIQSLFCRTFRWPKVDYFYMKNTYFKWIQWFPSFWDIPIYIYIYIYIYTLYNDHSHQYETRLEHGQ